MGKEMNGDTYGAATAAAPPSDVPVQRGKTPLWARAIGSPICAAVQRLYPYTVTGLEHYTATPATLAVSNHRRDADGPLLGSILARRRNGLAIDPFPHFVAREDLFEKGFLARYPHCPAGLRPLLRALNLRRLLTGLGVYPLQRTHECTVAEALRDVIAYRGDTVATDVLRPRALARLAAELGLDPSAGTTIGQLLREHEHVLWKKRYGYRQLQLVVFRHLKPRLRETIDRQLDHFSHLLERGQTVILEPEGCLSLDGGIRRPRAALHELVNRPNRLVRVLPVSVTHDTLTTGPARIFIDIQPELTGLEGLPRRVLDERIMSVIRAGCRVTGSQLAAGFLLLHSGSGHAWSTAAMTEHVYAAARRCHDATIPIDPCLLDRGTCELRTRDILAWGRRARFLTSEGGDRWRLFAPGTPPPWLPGRKSTLLGYLRAELLDTVGEARASDLVLLP